MVQRVNCSLGPFCFRPTGTSFSPKNFMPIINNFMTIIIEAILFSLWQSFYPQISIVQLGTLCGWTACILLTVAVCRLGTSIITMVCYVYVYVNIVFANTYMHVCVPTCVCLCVSFCVCLHVLFQTCVLCLVYI